MGSAPARPAASVGAGLHVRFAQDFKKNNRQLFSGGAIDKDWVYVDKVNDSKWNHMNAAAIGSERNYVHLWMIDERSKAAVQIERAVSFKELSESRAGYSVARFTDLAGSWEEV
jgi:hypothetical protein